MNAPYTHTAWVEALFTTAVFTAEEVQEASDRGFTTAHQRIAFALAIVRACKDVTEGAYAEYARMRSIGHMPGKRRWRVKTLAAFADQRAAVAELRAANEALEWVKGLGE